MVPHLSFDLRPGHQGRHRVNHNDVDGAAPHQDIGDLQGLLPRIGLGNEEVIGIHPQPFRIRYVQGVFGIDEGGDPSGLLRLGDGMEGEGRFP